jgi:hypothetical protein
MKPQIHKYKTVATANRCEIFKSQVLLISTESAAKVMYAEEVSLAESFFTPSTR